MGQWLGGLTSIQKDLGYMMIFDLRCRSLTLFQGLVQVGQGVEENLAGLPGKGSPRQRFLVLRSDGQEEEGREPGLGTQHYAVMCS